LATNAGGIRVVRYGPLRQWVLGLTLVDGTGTVHELGGPYLKDSSGYDLKSLIIGSEGTLGVVTEVTLRLTRPPRDSTVYLLALESYDQVVRLFRRARSLTSPLAAFEFFSGYCLERVLEFAPDLREPFAQGYSHYVLMEVESLPSSPGRETGAQSEMEELLADFVDQGVVADGTVAANSTQANTLWRYREEISEALSLHHIVHKNDISIPMAHLASFAPRLERELAHNYPEYRVAIFGHLGDGNLHINTVKPESMSAEDFFARMEQVNDMVYALVAEYGGSISAEHGIGLLKKKDLHWSHAEPELAIMRAIKGAFDPKGIMNPGKVLP
jgi:FAD/FMN-containing dehydrogenase